MNFKNILLKSFFVSNFIAMISFIFPIIPCVEYPNVPNPIRVWKFTYLGYKITNESHSVLEYFGYTQEIKIAYFSVLIISFVLSFFVLLVFNHKVKKRNKK